MNLDHIVGDVALFVLDGEDALAKLGIQQPQIFAKVQGLDEHGVWIEHPGWPLPQPPVEGAEDEVRFKRVPASVLLRWPFIISVVHFPGLEGFDLPNPFGEAIGFRTE